MFCRGYARHGCAGFLTLVRFFTGRTGGLLLLAIWLSVSCAVATAQNAAVYETPFEASTGTFEWDFFSGSGSASHAPDVTDFGGTASLSGTFRVDPGNGPPFPFISSVQNLYSGGTFPTYSVDLSELSDSGSSTTVVLQLAAIGDVFSDFALNGTAPSEFLNRGSVQNLRHGSGDAEFDTTFYWAAWPLEGDVRDSFDLTFNTLPHSSLAGLRIDYLTGEEVADVSRPSVLSMTGDFDRDLDVDVDDLDQFNGVIGTVVGQVASALDLNFDGTIGEDDFAEHYTQLVQTSNGAVGTAQGDVNLDGKVDVLGDAFLLVGNLGNTSSSWGEGDLNADGTVDVLGDAFALVSNLGFSNELSGSPAAAAVPEPSSIAAMLVGVLGIASRRHRVA